MLDKICKFFVKNRVESVRIIDINSNAKSSFCSNTVKTTKYTPYNFIFVNLYEQLSIPSNFYFVFIAILQSIPKISSTHGIPIILLPLTIVLLGNALKDAYEDYNRYLADSKVNNNIAKVISNPKVVGTPAAASELRTARGAAKGDKIKADNLIEKTWSKVAVGDLILLKNGDVVPADILLLGTSESNGTAFVETSCLDGESNLKKKEAVSGIYNFLTRDLSTALFRSLKISGCFRCEPPNNNLLSFSGALKYKLETEGCDFDGTIAPVDTPTVRHDFQEKADAEEPWEEGSAKLSTSMMQLLLRGCKLRNTKWIIGFVVYTGHDTKLYNNVAKAPHKLSSLNRMAVKLTFIVWVFQVILCSIAAGFNTYRHYYKLNSSTPYLINEDLERSSLYVAVVSFFSWIAMSATFVPISTIVTLNIARIMQAFFIQSDADMHHDETNMSAVARTTTLNEELGQINYMFSDKTGTLTCNRMLFRKFAVAGHSYGRGYTDIRRFVLRKHGIKLEDEPFNPKLDSSLNVNLVDDDLFLHLDRKHPRHAHLVEFFMHLACNNGVLKELNESDEEYYSSSSPDELCFVHAAKFAGFDLSDRTSNAITMKAFGRQINVRILAIVEFDYSRKCSSAILAFPKEPGTDPEDPDLDKFRIILFCKGGGSVIKQKLLGMSELDKQTVSYYDEYTRDGLRVLLFAKRELTTEEFLDWNQKYLEAQSNVLEREERISDCISLLERNLELQGVTGIEDKLQDGVDETIELLTLAGIKVWMLTGDTMETAINVGIATNLLRIYSERIYLDSSTHSLEQLGPALREKLKDIKSSSDTNKHRCLIVDGISTSELIKDENLDSFAELCKFCNTAICFRLTPSLKGSIVDLFKNKLGQVTVAVGDGGNDCNMIQTADVGIGLKGKEGVQAFNVSDYGIAQFRFLAPLLLNHGRNCYRRIAKTVSYMFYKNITLITPLFFYGYLSLFSCQRVYFEILVSIYNVFFTSANVLLLASTDQDLDRDLSYKYAYMYQLGQRNFYLSPKVFLSWLFNSFCHSTVIFLVTTFGLSDRFSVPTKDGTLLSSSAIGMGMITTVLIVVSLKLVLETWLYTRATTLIYLLVFSVFLFTVCGFSLSQEIGNSVMGSAIVVLSNGRFWIVLMTATMIAIYRDYCAKVLRYSFRPHYHHYIQHKEYLKTEIP